jgi:sugar-specific transcriptional regulator TrmB
MGREGSDLLGLLTGSGVPERGARLYLAACQGGPLTASELARVTALHRVEAYRFIQQLLAQGLLKEVGGRPKRFVALEPERLVDRWIHETSDRLALLERDREAIAQSWQESGDALGTGDGPKFTVLEGQSATNRLLVKRIGTAERQVLLTLSAGGLARLMDGGVDRALRDASQRGVKVRVLTDIHRAHLAEIKHFMTFAEVRHATTLLTHRSIVIDRTGALLFILDEGLTPAEDRDRQVALWSTRPSVVELSREYHHRMWTPGMRAENRLVAIESPDMTVLPVVTGRERDPFRQVRDITILGMRATGTRELRLSVPQLIEGIADQLGLQIAEALEAGSPGEVGKALAAHYREYAPGQLDVARERPLTLRIRNCFACTDGSTEIGRVMCPRLLSSVFEALLGGRWEVSKPDPTRHAARGCLFPVSAA